MKEVNKVAKKVWLDEDFIRLDGRIDEMIKYAMKVRTSNFCLSMVISPIFN